jgi:hypothetical protein
MLYLNFLFFGSLLLLSSGSSVLLVLLFRLEIVIIRTLFGNFVMHILTFVRCLRTSSILKVEAQIFDGLPNFSHIFVSMSKSALFRCLFARVFEKIVAKLCLV